MESQNGWCWKGPLEVIWASCTSWTNNGKGKSLTKLNKLFLFFKTWKMGPATWSIISCRTSPSALKQDTILAKAKNQLLIFVAVEKRALAAETWWDSGLQSWSPTAQTSRVGNLYFSTFTLLWPGSGYRVQKSHMEIQSQNLELLSIVLGFFSLKQICSVLSISVLDIIPSCICLPCYQ